MATAAAAPPTASQQMGYTLNLTGGLSTTNMSDITVRYWFTADDNDVTQLFFVTYYSQVNNVAITNDVTATFAPAPPANVTPTSDSYMELSFSAAAPALSFGTTANIQVVVHGPGGNGYSDKFNETNDYSFNAMDPGTGTYGPNNNITYYVKGVLVGGCEPSGTGGGGGSSSSSSSSSSSGTGSDSGSGVDANASSQTDASGD